MAIGSIRGLGRSLQDKHTHYEMHGHIGPLLATVEIPGYVADAFEAIYGKRIEHFDGITITADFFRNDQLVAECQNPYRPSSHLKGVIRSDSAISIDQSA